MLKIYSFCNKPRSLKIINSLFYFLKIKAKAIRKLVLYNADEW